MPTETKTETVVPVTETKTEAAAPAKTIAENLNSKVEIVAPEFSLDDFMNADFSDDPKLQETFSKEHSGLKDYKTILSRHVTPEGQKVLANIRADYTRKTQELGSLRQQLETERQAVLAEREALYNGEYARKVKAAAETKTEGLDPYTTEGLAKLIEIETAKRLAEQMKPMQEKLVLERQRIEAEAFVTAHPEIRTDAFKAKLIPLLQARQDLSVEDAYSIVRGQIADEQAKANLAEKTKQKTDVKQYIKNTPNGTQVDVAALPKNRSAREIYQMLMAAKK